MPDAWRPGVSNGSRQGAIPWLWARTRVVGLAPGAVRLRPRLRRFAPVVETTNGTSHGVIVAGEEQRRRGGDRRPPLLAGRNMMDAADMDKSDTTAMGCGRVDWRKVAAMGKTGRAAK
uniref:DUF834 domain-containing protein n=1 Tax=Setaria viridis TaxID=4556 RepID=A0A4U6TBE2_SETVI|nr:hypothetical protein SEVIR_9G514600v2 [Setaria viridis]